ncbi:MAG: 2-oxo acid dehydrogenase subunit E2 [Terracidiphilus sp.]|jgi:pyruvate/2-oxoglutarate dehydrogenase complex dihydrolipoamide acyltransferase (E2) component
MIAAIPILLERDNVNDETVTLVRWFAAHGDRVELDALLAEVETSKANVEIHAPAAGYLVQEFLQGEEVPVSAAIGCIAEEAPASAPGSGNAQRAAVAPPIPMAASTSVRTLMSPTSAVEPAFPHATPYVQRISPVALKMMEASGIPATAFAGKSVVRKQDILDYLNPPAPAQPAERPDGKTAAFSRSEITQSYKKVPLSKMKRSERTNLGAGVENTVSSSVSVTCFTRGFRRVVDSSLGSGSASAVIVYEVSRLLRKYPGLNATYRNGAMLQYDAVNLGFAMDDGRGLKVAVVPNCDALPLNEIVAMLHDLSVAYLEDKLTPAQTSNATFTVSDLSGLGVSGFVPLISENQGAILGVSGEQFAPDSTAGFYTLTLTFDHQLSNGRTAALFLGELKSRLASYESTAEQAGPELICSRCFRTARELSAMNQRLLRSAEPEGYLCTVCASGW